MAYITRWFLKNLQNQVEIWSAVFYWYWEIPFIERSFPPCREGSIKIFGDYFLHVLKWMDVQSALNCRFLKFDYFYLPVYFIFCFQFWIWMMPLILYFNKCVFVEICYVCVLIEKAYAYMYLADVLNTSELYSVLAIYVFCQYICKPRVFKIY